MATSSFFNRNPDPQHVSDLDTLMAQAEAVAVGVIDNANAAADAAAAAQASANDSQASAAFSDARAAASAGSASDAAASAASTAADAAAAAASAVAASNSASNASSSAGAANTKAGEAAVSATQAATAADAAQGAQTAAEAAEGAAAGYAASINPATLMPKTGGTFTGPVEIAASSAAFRINDSTGPTDHRQFQLTSYQGDLYIGAINDALDGAIYPQIIDHTTGTTLFLNRPVFGTATPWDNGNFDPTTKLDKTGGTLTGPITFQDSGDGLILSGGGRLYDYSTTGTYLLANGDDFSVYQEAGAPRLFRAASDGITYKNWNVWHEGSTGTALGHGQCRFNYTNTTTLTLVPYNGNRLVIDGVSRVIPAAGVTITNSSWVAGAHRYVYAYWTGSAIALEASTTPYETNTTTGVVVKIGDPTRTLVGSAVAIAGNVFAYSNVTCSVLSYFNRRRIRLFNSSFATVSSLSWVNVSNTYLNFITWADEVVESHAIISVDVPDTCTGVMGIAIDGSVTGGYAYTYAGSGTGNWFDTLSAVSTSTGWSETVMHYSGVSEYVTGGSMPPVGGPIHVLFIWS